MTFDELKQPREVVVLIQGNQSGFYDTKTGEKLPYYDFLSEISDLARAQNVSMPRFGGINAFSDPMCKVLGWTLVKKVKTLKDLNNALQSSKNFAKVDDDDKSDPYFEVLKKTGENSWSAVKDSISFYDAVALVEKSEKENPGESFTVAFWNRSTAKYKLVNNKGTIYATYDPNKNQNFSQRLDRVIKMLNK